MKARPLVKIGHENDIPLVGTLAFGLIDRGTNLIQVRPISGCVLNCIFCSIDEGPLSKSRLTRYYVELDYLMEWFEGLARYKGNDGIEAHIDCAGDPTLYSELEELVARLKEVRGVEVISMQTHGTLLDEKRVDRLEAAGLSRINLSIDAMNHERARLLSGVKGYNVERVLKLAEYIAESKIDLLIAPVWVPGFNDEEMPKIVEFALRIGAGKRWPPLGIQKYEAHKRGRRPARPWTYRAFYRRLRELEKKFRVRLRLRRSDFGIRKRPMLPIPFERGEVVKVKTVSPGWMYDEAIGVTRNRAVTIAGLPFYLEGMELKVRIEKTKHNIIMAKPTEKTLMTLRLLHRNR